MQRPCRAEPFCNNRPDASHRANFRGAFGTDDSSRTFRTSMLLINKCVTFHKTIGRIIPLLLAVVLAATCSTRVEYTSSNSKTITAPDAINLNTATIEELDRLPNIGRKTAESIVAFRDENGPFRRPEHLMLIRGVSETRFIEIRDLIRTR